MTDEPGITPLPADGIADPEQPPMDDAAGGPDVDADDMVPTRDDPAGAESAAHPS